MRQQSIEMRINELLAQLVAEVRGSTALGLTDINKFCEDCLVPVLKQALDLPRLRNLNQTEKRNFPAVDLADDDAETAIQVTATPDRRKIIDTLAKFAAHGLHTKYRRLLVYVIVEKQERYSETGVSEAIGGHTDFDINRDVIDYRDVLRALHGKPLETLDVVLRTLERQLTQSRECSLGDNETSKPVREEAFLNLLSIKFPSTLYVADIVFDEDGRRSRRRRGTKVNLRDRVRSLMNQRDIRFSADWTCHKSQVIAFHDLSNPSLPISEIVDQGTVTELAPDEYYGEDADQERVFKSLLHNCLKQALFKKGIQWQDKAEIFIFCPTEDGQVERQETWGSARTTRTVYRRIDNKRDPTRVFNHKHLAFSRQFLCLDDVWFLAIRPEWFFSSDGYKKSRFADKNISWLKKHEWNKNVFTHLRFLVDFLTTEPQDDLFDSIPPEPYPFLRFDSLVCLPDLPALPDNKWLFGESVEKRKRIEYNQEELPF